MTALITGVKQNWISHLDEYTRAALTLKTFLKDVPNVNGFYYHYLNMKDAQRNHGSEVSIIDTGLLLSGAIAAGEFFGGEVQDLANDLSMKVACEFKNWGSYYDLNGKVIEKIHDYGALKLDDSYKDGFTKTLISDNI